MLVKHPIWFVGEVLSNHPEIEFCELSVYRYIPQAQDCERNIIVVPVPELFDRYEELKSGLAFDQEIAFHSRVYKGIGRGKRTFHIPMIDFKGEINSYFMQKIRKALYGIKCSRATLYFSGRSSHLYGDCLLSTKEWQRFCYGLLVVNPIRGPGGVDTRWIAHRVIDGYASLRWTCNSMQYLAEPQLVRYLTPKVVLTKESYPYIIRK